MHRSVSNQPHLHGQKVVPGLRQDVLQGDHSSVELSVYDEDPLLVSRCDVQQHLVPRDGIGRSHAENVSGHGRVAGEADVVKGDSQGKRETRRRVLHELACNAVATAEKGKNRGTGSLSGAAEEAGEKMCSK